MKCGHCGRCDGNVTVDHVWNCSQGGTLRAPSNVTPLRAVRRLNDDANEGRDIAGIYVFGVDYFRVVLSQYGRWYVKKWDVIRHVWDYAGASPLAILTSANKITAEQAAAFGEVFKTCVNCGQALSDPRSEAVGYGPTCAANNGWPWGEVLDTSDWPEEAKQ